MRSCFPKGGFPVIAETTRNHIFSKEISQVIFAAMALEPNFYCKNCLRVVSAMRGNPPSFLVDPDKKYTNEIEMDKNDSVTYMEYVYFQVRVSRTQKKSLPNFQVQIQKIKIHDLRVIP